MSELCETRLTQSSVGNAVYQQAGTPPLFHGQQIYVSTNPAVPEPKRKQHQKWGVRFHAWLLIKDNPVLYLGFVLVKVRNMCLQTLVWPLFHCWNSDFQLSQQITRCNVVHFTAIISWITHSASSCVNEHRSESLERLAGSPFDFCIGDKNLTTLLEFILTLWHYNWFKLLIHSLRFSWASDIALTHCCPKLPLSIDTEMLTRTAGCTGRRFAVQHFLRTQLTPSHQNSRAFAVVVPKLRFDDKLVRHLDGLKRSDHTATLLWLQICPYFYFRV